jgi:hypothetical protein
MYKEKYIKYKIKYFNLKSQLGGMPPVMRGVPLPLNTTRKGTALPHIPLREMYTYVKSAISPKLEQKEQRDKEIKNKIAERKKKKEAEAVAATAAADKKKNNKKNNKKDKKDEKKDEEKDEASGEIIHSGAVSSDEDESSDDNSSTSTTSTDPTIRIVRESTTLPKPAPIPYLGIETSQQLPPPVGPVGPVGQVVKK